MRLHHSRPAVPAPLEKKPGAHFSASTPAPIIGIDETETEPDEEALDVEVVLPEGSNPLTGSPASFFSTKYNHLREHLRDPLYRNGYALMINSAVTAGLGLIYWSVASHIYSDDDVGAGFAQVSAMMLISTVTQLNFASVLIRFVPRAGRATRGLLLRAYGISAIFAAAVSTLVLIIGHAVVGPDNALIGTSLAFGVWFVIAAAAWSIFNLQDAAMTGLRRAIWVPVENGTFGIVKIGLLFAFVPLFGAVGIFTSWTIPVLLSLIPINYAIFRNFVPRHIWETRYREQPLEVSKIRKYMAGDYTAGLLAQMSTTLIPILVVGILSKEAAAYFGMAQTMALALDLVAFNLANSLTVEAAGQENRTVELTRSVLRRTATIVIPAAIFLIVAAPLLLDTFFPAEYKEESTDVLRLLALACIPKILISVHNALARLQHKTHRIAVLTTIQAILMVGGSVVLMKEYGINGIGAAALISNSVVALLVLPYLLRALHHREGGKGPTESEQSDKDEADLPTPETVD